MLKSTSLLRTNVSLTTNVKIVVDSNYNLYLESYNTNNKLSDKKYKKFHLPYDSFLSQKLASFYYGLPTDIAFDVKNDIKSDIIQINYTDQYDDIYFSGARNIEDTRYKEEFQYNTTLKIEPSNLPKYFMIFRVNGPGVEEITKNNVEEKYINKLQLISTFDLTVKSNFGKFWQKNYIDDDELPRSPVELNFKKYEFSKWNGYDYISGGTTSKSSFMYDIMQNQTTPFDLETIITDGFKKNNVISSHFSNVSYLFDDTVADIFKPGVQYSIIDYPFIEQYIQEGNIKSGEYTRNIDNDGNVIYTFNNFLPYRKKWTINRYTGFYIDDIIEIDKLSTYNVPEFNSGNYIVNNVFRNGPNETDLSVNPINNNELNYFKINNNLYKVSLNDNNEYILISDIIYNGIVDDFINNKQKTINIKYLQCEENGITYYRNIIKNTDDSFYTNLEMINFQDSIYIIDILDKKYRINVFFDSNINVYKTYIMTDEYIDADNVKIIKKLGFHNIEANSLEILTEINDIKYFYIYKLQFTDIADFDFTREITSYAKIEGERADIPQYYKPSLYMTNINDISSPQDFYYEKYYQLKIYDKTDSSLPNDGLVFTMGQNNENFILPLNSEYAVSGDLYMFNQDSNSSITKLWNLNQNVNKWGIKNSVNNVSYPYKINNSLIVGGQFNYAPNIFNNSVSYDNLSLDWFYSLNSPLSENSVLNENTIEDSSVINEILNGQKAIDYIIKDRSLNIDMMPLNVGAYNEEILNENTYVLKNNYYKFDIEFYKDNSNTTIDYFNCIFNMPVNYDISEYNVNNTIKYVIENNHTEHKNRISYFTNSDGVNGPSVFFKGLSSYIQYCYLEDPNNINSKYTVSPADDISGYGFSIIYCNKETFDISLLGKAGIDIHLNKIHKNVLIHIYVYVIKNSVTSLDWRNRDYVYNESYIRYITADEIPVIDWKMDKTDLDVNALNLTYILNLLDTNGNEDKYYTDGIHYDIIDIDENLYYDIDNAVLDNLTGIVTLTFKNETTLKHNDWIYFEINNDISNSKNYKIIDRIDNKTIKIRANTDININTVIFRKEKSVLPFKFKIIYPNEIKINSAINKLIPINDCPVKGQNTISNISSISYNIDNNIFDNDIPNLYVDDSISRAINKSLNSTSLTYNQIDLLPSIYRYSGDYEPILNDINIFNKPYLYGFNNQYSDNTQIDAETIYAGLNEVSVGIYNFVVYLNYFTAPNVLNALINENTHEINIKIGDMITFNDINNIDKFNFINKKTYQIKSIDILKDNNNVNKYIKIIINKDFTENDITFNGVFSTTILDDSPITVISKSPDSEVLNYGVLVSSTSSVLNSYIFRYIDKNLTFAYNFYNFGELNEQIVSKVYEDINPLLTSVSSLKKLNKYPMIDEHGSTTIKRFLFKSNWDKDFYYKTIKGDLLT